MKWVFFFLVIINIIIIYKHSQVKTTQPVIKPFTQIKSEVAQTVIEKKSETNYVSRVSPRTPEHQETFEEFEDEWNEDIYEMLVINDPHHANEIYEKVLLEQQTHEALKNENLTIALNHLTQLNGESGVDPFGTLSEPEDPMQLEREHRKRIKTILGDHYESIRK